MDKPLSSNQVAMIGNALALLRAMNCRYAVVLPDGKLEEHGIDKGGKRKRRSAPAYPVGTQLAYLEPFLSPMDIGDEIIVPNDGRWDQDSLQSGVCNWCRKKWGTGQFTSQQVEGGVKITYTLGFHKEKPVQLKLPE